MKNKQISPGKIPHLVRLTADLFRNMREETKAPNMNPTFQRDEYEQMHFVADLLKQLVDTAFPIENEFEEEELQGQEFHVIQIGESTPFTKESLDKAMENIANIMKSYKPPKVGEF